MTLLLIGYRSIRNQLYYIIYLTGWQGNGGGIWVDATFVNDIWQWIDGSTWFNWAAGEPANFGQCLQLYRDGKEDVEKDYRFDDLDCSMSREFASEKLLF